MKFEGIFGGVELERWHTPKGPDVMELISPDGGEFYMRPDKLEHVADLFSTSRLHRLPTHGKKVWIQSYHKDGLCLLVAIQILKLSWGNSRSECYAVFSNEQCRDIQRFIESTEMKGE